MRPKFLPAVPNAIYNEIDLFAARWLESLIAGGHLPPGAVLRGPIESLQSHDVAGRGQRHFFAGISGWSLALRLAGVPDDADVWTGSCPCQPFSSASRGRGGGFASPKHLWPHWFRLIRECRPPVVLGEQVATGDGLAWLDAAIADLEHDGYAVGAVRLCASAFGFAPRDRVFFVAYADGKVERYLPVDGEVAGVRSAADVVASERLHVHPVDSERDGFPGALGQRRAYGNAVNPVVTAAFIEAALGVTSRPR